MAETTWDVIVVGSGAAGGWVAKELTERGVKTLLLEAGPALDPERDFTPPADRGPSRIQLASRARAFLGGQHMQSRCMSFSPLTRHLFVNDRQNPYTTPKGKPFNWYRSRQVGGRMHLWGRNAVRMSDHEFKAASHDGWGDEWPIGYDDLAPWYAHVEQFLGVHGSAAAIENIPDGLYDRPHWTTSAESRMLRDMREKWPDRPATTSRIVRHNADRVPLPILAAHRTGRLTLRSDTVVSHLEVDPVTGHANGVATIDRSSGRASVEKARVVVLCASTIESLRILLNSRSARHPHGLGNAHGLLGTSITDHVMVFQAGPFDPLEPAVKSDAYDFGAQTGIYIPSFRNTVHRRHPDYLRGFSMLGSVGRIAPGWFFMAVGEMLPRPENRVELDPSRKDAWGIPAARISCVHSDNEHAMVRDMKACLQELAADFSLPVSHLESESLVSKLFYKLASPLVYTREGALLPGSAIHEAGGAAMGTSPVNSVLNRDAACWDAPNVYVTDSAAFTTSPFQNPGLTIMALSARAGHHIADEMMRRNL